MRQIYGPVIIAPTIGAFGITSLSSMQFCALITFDGLEME